MAMSILSVGGRNVQWLDRLGIDKRCRLVAMCRGMVTLTVDADGVHTLWIYDHALVTGDDARPRYNLLLDHRNRCV